MIHIELKSHLAQKDGYWTILRELLDGYLEGYFGVTLETSFSKNLFSRLGLRIVFKLWQLGASYLVAPFF